MVNNQRQPRNLSLRHILDEYLTFQEEVIVRRTRFDLKKAQERAHLLEGLLIAQDNIDEVIRIIRESYDNAKENLMQRFGLSDVQAQAILDMQLKRLQGLEKEKLQAEYDELEKKIAYYQEILADENKVKAVLKDELLEIREKYGDDRLTEIQDVEDEIDIEDLIEEEACCYTLSSLGYIKRLPTSTYRAQKRGGRGVTAQTLKEEDYVKRLFVASTHDYLLFFSNTGKVHRRKGYRIPEAGRHRPGHGHCERPAPGARRDHHRHAPHQGHGGGLPHDGHPHGHRQALGAILPQYQPQGGHPRHQPGRGRRAHRRLPHHRK